MTPGEQGAPGDGILDPGPGAFGDAAPVPAELGSFLLDLVGDGLWELDLLTRTVRVSPRWGQTLGVEVLPNGIPVKDVEGVVHEEDHPAVTAAFRAFIAGAVSAFDQEHRVRLGNGSTLWIRNRARILRRDPDGRPLVVVGVVTDVTRRKVLAADLERERRIFADGPVVVFRWAAREGWPVEYVSANIRQWGYAPDDFYSGTLHFAPLVHPDDLDRVAREVSEHTAAGAAWFEQDYRMRRRDGNWIHVYDHTVVVRDAEFRATHFEGYLLDVTRWRTLEDQLRRAHSSESAARLLGSAGHEFNNLLTIILGSLEFAAAAVRQGSDVSGHLEQIRRAADRAAALTARLVAAGRGPVSPVRSFEVFAFLRDNEELLRREVGDRGRLVLDPTGPVVTVDADPAAMRQVIFNLVVSAREVAGDGGTITVGAFVAELSEDDRRCRFGLVPGRYAGFVVASSGGVGRGAAVGATGATEAGATGFGERRLAGLELATTFSVVREAGGLVDVDFGRDGVVAFRVLLPAAAERLRVAGPVNGRTGASVLLVEDDPAVRSLFATFLQGAGYAPLAVASVEEALRIFDANPEIALLVTDLVLGDTDGVALVLDLRRRAPTLPVLCLSGDVASRRIERLGGLHGVEVVAKPVGRDAFLGRVRAALGPAPTPPA